jgi:hypothetical protein
MTPLRAKYIRDLVIRGRSKHTQEAYIILLLHLLKLSGHKLRVLWQLAACGTPALGANLFHCPHCQHRHWGLAPAATGIVRAAWPPKAGNG